MNGYFDGSCEPINPGGVGKFGWAILGDGGIEHAGHGTCGFGKGMTNNIAEYHGLINILKEIDYLQMSDEIDCVYGDSLMVVNMATGKWGKKNPHKHAPHLLPLCLEARELVEKLGITVEWISREENTVADYYSKLP